MKLLDDDTVQLYPKNEAELFPFLVRITQEWHFLANALDCELPGVTASYVANVVEARNTAINLFNEWALEQVGRQWFRVLQRSCVPEDTWSSREQTVITAGTQILVFHKCEQVLAHVNAKDLILLNSNCDEILVGQAERVELHCIIAPPRDDELRVLPLEVVPDVAILNH